MDKGESFHLKAIRERASEQGRPYLEFLRRSSMSAGLYRLSAGSRDGQRPHSEDELYYVVRGRSKFEVEGEVVPAEPGSLLFVAAGAQHRFFEITENLEVLVFFAPAETE